MLIETAEISEAIAAFIRREAPVVNAKKLFLRKVLEVLGIYIPKVPEEFQNARKIISNLGNEYVNIQWFNYNGLYGIVAQCVSTNEVAFIPIFYCPNGHPSGGYVQLNINVNVPKEKRLLLELHYVLSRGLKIPFPTPQQMVVGALLLKTGTLAQKVDSLQFFGVIDPAEEYPEELINNLAEEMIGGN